MSDEERVIIKKCMSDKKFFGNNFISLKDADEGWQRIKLRDYQEKLIASVNTEYGCRQITSMIYESAIPAFVRAMKTRNSSPYEIYLNENGNGCLREVPLDGPSKALQVLEEEEKEAEYES